MYTICSLLFFLYPKVKEINEIHIRNQISELENSDASHTHPLEINNPAVQYSPHFVLICVVIFIIVIIILHYPIWVICLKDDPSDNAVY